MRRLDTNPEPRFPREAELSVAPFTRQPEGDEVIIGLPEKSAFVVLPADAVDVLDWIAGGATAGEAADRYRAEHGEEPDLEGLLRPLEARGFVRRTDAPAVSVESAGTKVKSFHFDWIAQRVARRIFAAPVVFAACSVVAAALLVLVGDPALMPDWSALYFPERLAVMGPSLLAFGLTMIFIHEMAHLIAARAVGVSCRLGIGNRLWIPVAETDMTGVWAVERRKRYLPLLAGPLVDATSAAVLVFVLAGAKQGWLEPSASAVKVVQAMLLIYALNLVWQCYFFVRTDFYYVLANYFGCKSLLADTERYLVNLLARRFPRLGARDLSHVPASEMRVVRWYSGIWLLGRVVAVGVLLFVQLPIAWSYLKLIGRAIAGSSETASGTEGVLGAAFFLAFFALGLALWLRSLRRSASREART